MDARPPRVAAITPNWLGDVVMAFPALRAFASAPTEPLDIWTPRAFAPLAEAVLPKATVIPFDLGRGGLVRLKGRLRLARRMRARAYRSAVLFPNSFGSALVAWRAGIAERIGTPLHSRGLLITRKVEPQGASEHLADAYVRLAEEAAGVRLKAADAEAALALPDDVRAQARATLAEAGLDEGERFVAMAPGAAYGPAKQWGEANFAAVALLVAKASGAATVVVGTGADSAAAAEIALRAEGARVVDLAGRTDLLGLAGVLSLGIGFVGNDSGAAHLAGALGVATVAVYLSTDPVRTGQRGARVRLIPADVECRPCMRRHCPRGYQVCRDAVTPEDVAAALAEASA